mmetsp:Transcript_11657/g.17843  ORF Transcript_11657/g.17843 Transcript_11657/m.17843 type:complete len:132 (-) Transcript_11657:222-617(-)
MMVLNQSKVDRENCTSTSSSLAEHHTSVSSQSRHDKEELRQELLGKVCFSSSRAQKPSVKPPKKKKSSEEASAVVDEERTNDDSHHHGAGDAKPQRTCRSKHSQRRAAKRRSQQQQQQQLGRIKPSDDSNE